MKWFNLGARALKHRGSALVFAAAMVVGAPAPSAEAFGIFIPGIYFGHNHHYSHHGYGHRHYGYHNRHHGYRHYASHHRHGSSHASSSAGGGGKHLLGTTD